jgi:hypothetical protein
MLVLLAGCTSLGPSDGPSPDASLDASGRPRPRDLCLAIEQLQEDIGDFRELRIRPEAKTNMLLRFGSIQFSAESVLDLTPDARDQLANDLQDAVTTLGLSVEDYRTTDRPGEAEAYVRRSTDAVGRATRALRNAVGCGRPRPT